jgi:hypothetical protein
MQMKRPKRRVCVQRAAERRFAKASEPSAVAGFERGLLMVMGLSQGGAEMVRDALNTYRMELATAMESLHVIAALPRNRGARRYAQSTIAFLDTTREEKAKPANKKGER